MADERSPVHLAPEIFVDLLDGAPIDAERRLHVARCAECQRELLELEQTLDRLKSAQGAQALAPESRGSRPSPRRHRLWLGVAAAVLVAFVLVLHRGGDVVAPPAPGESESERLLPPMDEDEDFRLLLALSEATESDLPEDWYDSAGRLSPDASGLTPVERQELLEKLALELRSSS